MSHLIFLKVLGLIRNAGTVNILLVHFHISYEILYTKDESRKQKDEYVTATVYSRR